MYHRMMSASSASTYTEKSKKSLRASPIVPLLRGRGGCRTLSPSIMRMSGCRTTSCWLGTMS